MENEKRNEPEKYNVLYCKGKYQYKSKYPQIETKHKVIYAGPVEPMAPIWDNVSDILRNGKEMLSYSLEFSPYDDIFEDINEKLEQKKYIADGDGWADYILKERNKNKVQFAD